jgi:hypothetical protein
MSQVSVAYLTVSKKGDIQIEVDGNQRQDARSYRVTVKPVKRVFRSVVLRQHPVTDILSTCDEENLEHVVLPT